MPPDAALAVFEAERPRLLRLGYRMLGSMSEAEDVVQDCWLRWQAVEHAVREPAAFLSRIVTRLCLDRMKSARARRETYIGPWLPEPFAENDEAPREDELTLTLMLALERLSPLERAAFLLHDVFGMPLGEVAETLDRDAAAVRQLAVRARKHVHAARPRFPVAEAEGERIARAFFAATHDGDLAELQKLLRADAVLRSDGGGKVSAFRNPIRGVERLLRLYHGLHRKRHFTASERFVPIRIDGLPAFISIERGVLQTTAFEIEDGRIAGILITRNPDKLRRIAATLAARG